MAKVKGVGHVVLGVRDPQRAISFYTEVLGMELVNFLEEMQMAFFSFGERDHDLAVIKVPEDAPVGSSGLAHTAFEIEGGLEQLGELHSCPAEPRRRGRVHRGPRAHEEPVLPGSRRQPAGALLAGHVSRRGQGVPAPGPRPLLTSCGHSTSRSPQADPAGAPGHRAWCSETGYFIGASRDIRRRRQSRRARRRSSSPTWSGRRGSVRRWVNEPVDGGRDVRAGPSLDRHPRTPRRDVASAPRVRHQTSLGARRRRSHGRRGRGGC